MSTAFKEVLDDAAAARDLSVDLDDVLTRVARRRFRMRAAGSALLLAAAAAVLGLLAVVVVVPVVQPATTDGPGGLPKVWYPTPSYLPELKAGQMKAASMLVNGGEPRENGPGDDRPTLVSADGRTYARLPQGPDSSFAALSPDGTQVAWVSGCCDAELVLHRMRLSDAKDVRQTLPITGEPIVLLWGGDSIYLTLSRGNPVRTYRIQGARVGLQEECSLPLGVDGRGQAVFDVTSHESMFDSIFACDRNPGAQVSPLAVVDPAGRRAATLISTDLGDGTSPRRLALAVSQEKRLRQYALVDSDRTLDDEVTSGRVLAWTASGVLVGVDTSGVHDTATGSAPRYASSIQLFDPESHAWTVVGRSQRPWAVPVSVASDLVGRPTVDGAEPTVPWYDLGRLGYERSRLWASYSGVVYGVAGGLFLLALGVLIGRFTRRRALDPE